MESELGEAEEKTRPLRCSNGPPPSTPPPSAARPAGAEQGLTCRKKALPCSM